MSDIKYAYPLILNNVTFYAMRLREYLMDAGRVDLGVTHATLLMPTIGVIDWAVASATSLPALRPKDRPTRTRNEYLAVRASAVLAANAIRLRRLDLTPHGDREARRDITAAQRLLSGAVMDLDNGDPASATTKLSEVRALIVRLADSAQTR